MRVSKCGIVAGSGPLGPLRPLRAADPASGRGQYGTVAYKAHRPLRYSMRGVWMGMGYGVPTVRYHYLYGYNTAHPSGQFWIYYSAVL